MSTDLYYKHVGKFDLLKKHEEQALAKKAHEGCIKSKHLLVEHNLRLALHIAKKYSKTKCSMEDLIAEANVGLCKAVEKFDYTKGFRFSTYATWWIKQAILRYISRSTTIKFASGARKKIYQINIARKNYYEEFGSYPDDTELATLLGMELTEVSELRQANQWPINLDQPMRNSEGRTYGDLIPDDSIQDNSERLDHQQIIENIKAKLPTLKPLEERVMRLRFGITDDAHDTTKFPQSRSNQ
jgi:RNA polymerase primary sigma factor